MIALFAIALLLAALFVGVLADWVRYKMRLRWLCERDRARNDYVSICDIAP